MRESGTYAGIRFLHWIHSNFGRGVFSIVLYVVSIYFLIARKEQRQASQQYLRYHYQKYPDSWERYPRWRDSLRHFREFGDAVLDKALAWSSPIAEAEFDIENRAAIDDILADSRGQLIIGTHLGNLEYCRGFMHANKNKIINILIHDRHSANFARAMETLNPESRLNIFQVDQMDVSMILTLKNKVQDGEWLFIAGDRVPDNGMQRTVSATFLGQTAQFPIGPYHLAMTLECPVKLMFAYRLNKRIKVDLIDFSDKIELPRPQREETVKKLAQTFASAIEAHCSRAPFQWFNFYNFWALAEQQTTESGHRS